MPIRKEKSHTHTQWLPWLADDVSIKCDEELLLNEKKILKFCFDILKDKNS